jgi:hypothetical protein
MKRVPSITLPDAIRYKPTGLIGSRTIGIWTERANPDSDARENPQFGKPSGERLNQRKEESVDKEIEDRKGNDDGLECLADAFTGLKPADRCLSLRPV